MTWLWLGRVKPRRNIRTRHSPKRPAANCVVAAVVVVASVTTINRIVNTHWWRKNRQYSLKTATFYRQKHQKYKKDWAEYYVHERFLPHTHTHTHTKHTHTLAAYRLDRPMRKKRPGEKGPRAGKANPMLIPGYHALNMLVPPRLDSNKCMSSFCLPPGNEWVAFRPLNDVHVLSVFDDLKHNWIWRVVRSVNSINS